MSSPVTIRTSPAGVSSGGRERGMSVMWPARRTSAWAGSSAGGTSPAVVPVNRSGSSFAGAWPFQSRGSVRTPVTADTAHTSGLAR